MAILKVPSLQHLARNWKNTPEATAKELVKLVKNPPRFSYRPLDRIIHDLIVLGVPYEQIEEAVRRVKNRIARESYLSVLPLVSNYFTDVFPDFYQSVERRHYPIGRGLMVPFEPLMVYGVGGQLYFPWFSFWRGGPLTKERLSLFVTLVDELLMQDPDLEDARFHILDFSCPPRKNSRVLQVIDANDIPRVGEFRKRQMLDIFVEGYLRALKQLEEYEKDNSMSHAVTPAFSSR